MEGRKEKIESKGEVMRRNEGKREKIKSSEKEEK